MYYEKNVKIGELSTYNDIDQDTIICALREAGYDVVYDQLDTDTLYIVKTVDIKINNSNT